MESKPLTRVLVRVQPYSGASQLQTRVWGLERKPHKRGFKVDPKRGLQSLEPKPNSRVWRSGFQTLTSGYSGLKTKPHVRFQGQCCCFLLSVSPSLHTLFKGHSLSLPSLSLSPFSLTHSLYLFTYRVRSEGKPDTSISSSAVTPTPIASVLGMGLIIKPEKHVKQKSVETQEMLKAAR